MHIFAPPSMVALLEAEKATLDRLFGEGAYEIDSNHPQHARLRSALLEIGFGCERDGQIGSSITLRDPPAGTGGCAGTWVWASLLGVKTRPLKRDRHGRVCDPAELQTQREVALIARVVSDIFVDPQRRRDAAFFVEGSTCAYNEWLDGEWDVPQDE